MSILGAGNVRIHTVNGSGVITGSRVGQFSRSTWAPVARRVDGGRLHWRTTLGGYTGWSYVPGSSPDEGLWRIVKRYSDGSSVAIAKTGS